MRTDLREIIVENASSDVRSVIVPTILSTLLCTGFSRMIITSYDLNVPFPDTMFMALIFSAVFCYLFCKLKTSLSVLVLVVTPLLGAFLIWRDFVYSRQALQALLFYIKENSLHSLPLDITMNYNGVDYMGGLFQILNAFPIAITAFVLTRFKRVIWVPIIYLPYFICSLANLGCAPHPVSCEITAASLILLLFLHALRRRKSADSRGIVLRMALPVLAVAIITGFFFPLERYDKYELAYKYLRNIRTFIDNSVFGSNRGVQMVVDLAEKGKVSAFVMSTVGCDAGSDTNLANIGSLSAPQYLVGTVEYNANYGYVPIANAPNTVNAVYLRAAAKSEYTGMAWNIIEAPRPVYTDNLMVNNPTARYNITIHSEVESEVSLTPYYCDFYTRFESRDIGVNSRASINPHSTVTGRGSDAEYHTCPLPVRTGNIYTERYLEEYVYGQNLQVPASTRNAIIQSGVLPDWYIQVMNGEVEMSDVDKVRYVTEFVRNLHPYDDATGYPPAGSDFVVWFMTRCRTGFCVHYASTAVILLRMLDVPARYVDGYLINDCYPGRETSFFMSDGHAWFEFFDPEFGWIMGDPTPGNSSCARYYDVNALMACYPDYLSRSTTPYEAIEISLFGNETENGGGSGEGDGPGEGGSGEGSGSEGGESDITIEGNSAAEQAASQFAEQLYSDEDETSDADLLEAQRAQKRESFKARVELFFTGLLFLAVLLLILRLVYIAYWLIRFAKKDINARAIAYYRYLDSNRFILGGRLPRAATAIAEKAAYSDGKITPAELHSMIKMCTRRPRGLARSMPEWLKIPYLIVGLAVTHWCR